MKHLIKKFNLPNYLKGDSFAADSKLIEARFKDQNSKEDKETKATLLGRLRDAQEYVKGEMDLANGTGKYAFGGEVDNGKKRPAIHLPNDIGIEPDKLAKITSAYQKKEGLSDDELKGFQDQRISDRANKAGRAPFELQYTRDWQAKRTGNSPNSKFSQTSPEYMEMVDARGKAYDTAYPRTVNPAVQKYYGAKDIAQFAHGGSHEYNPNSLIPEGFESLGNEQPVANVANEIPTSTVATQASGTMGEDLAKPDLSNITDGVPDIGQLKPAAGVGATDGASDGADAGGAGGQVGGTTGAGIAAGASMVADFIPTNMDAAGRVKEGAVAAKGAIKGAAAGAQFGVVGAAVGGVIGGVSGLLGGGKTNKAIDKAAQTLARKQTNAVDSRFAMGGTKKYGHGGDHPYDDILIDEADLKGRAFGDTDDLGRSLYSDRTTVKKTKSLLDSTTNVSNIDFDLPGGEGYSRRANDAEEKKIGKGKFFKNAKRKISDIYGDFKEKNPTFGAEALRLAPIAMNALQLKNLKKPETEGYDKLDARYKKQIVDEKSLQNIVRESEANTRGAILGSSGGSGSVARANILGAQINTTKALSDAYLKASGLNRSEGRMEQEFNLAIDRTNLGQSNREILANAQNLGAYNTQKSQLRAAIATDFGSLGKEELFKKYPELMGYDYDDLGRFIKWDKAQKAKKAKKDKKE